MWRDVVVRIRIGVVGSHLKGDVRRWACFLAEDRGSDNLYLPPHWVVSPVSTDIFRVTKELNWFPLLS